MKIKDIATVLLIAVSLAACAPAGKVLPTETAVPRSTPIPPPVQGPAVLGDNLEIKDWEYLGPESIESFPSLSVHVREVGKDIYLVRKHYGFDLVWLQVVCATQPVLIVRADAVIEFWPAAKLEPCEAMGVGHMLTVQWEIDIPFDEWKFIFHPPPEPEA
jgi:hypothetical protein